MSAKNLDQKGRMRNKIVSFRMSQEESKMLDNYVSISGMTKQDYIIKRVLQENIIINGNPRVFKKLKLQIENIICLLQNLHENVDLTEEQLIWINKVVRIYKELNS